MFQSKGRDFEIKSEGNKTTGALFETGCGIHNLLFSWCPFASTAAVAGGEGEEHRKGRHIHPVEVVKCLAMQSLMSQNRFFVWL